MPCKMKDCYTRKLRRFGLCVKHAKWVEKGIMTPELVVLRPLKKVRSYEGKECKIPGCETRPRRNNLCERHHSKVKRGTMTMDGESHLKRPLRYSPDATCLVEKCGRKGKIVRGLCAIHYESWRKGFTDFHGFDLGKRKRVRTYKGKECLIRGCFAKPRSNGFCRRHYPQYAAGVFDKNGNRLRNLLTMKNHGQPCVYPGCSEPFHCKGYCRLHYSRYAAMKKDLGDPVRTKASDRKCTAEGCTSPQYSGALCTKHYSRAKRGKPLNREYKNLGKKCSNHPEVKAYCKGLCCACYEKRRRASILTRDEKPVTLVSEPAVSETTV